MEFFSTTNQRNRARQRLCDGRSRIYHGMDTQLINFAHGEVLGRGNVWTDLCIYPKLLFPGLPGSLVLLISISSATFVPNISSFYRTGRLQVFKEVSGH